MQAVSTNTRSAQKSDKKQATSKQDCPMADQVAAMKSGQRGKALKKSLNSTMMSDADEKSSTHDQVSPECPKPMRPLTESQNDSKARQESANTTTSSKKRRIEEISQDESGGRSSILSD